jgi:hypothetical protein
VNLLPSAEVRGRVDRTHLLGVIPNLTNDDRRQGDFLALKLVRANRALLSRDPQRGELSHQEVGHRFDILDIAGGVSAHDTTVNEKQT